MSTIQTKDWELPSRYSAEVSEARKANAPVHPLVLNRWSPRAYEPRQVPDELLATVLETARWAPSSSNQQPWRFYVARTPKEHATFCRFIKPNNRLWTDGAPVLLLIASEKLKENGDPNGSHAFDAGAAWGILALQAQLVGLSTRALGGFDRELARESLGTPANLELHAVIALGYRADAASLPEALREREKPNGRRPAESSLLAVPTEAIG
ncbi:nitroreductase family protein [Cohnella yongneupensis]|uniref:Nitroreductase family protein n=1 Tax=Cohnella yongneupensis TaxID=425006 RepID=A0ABW0R4H6_9BACL